MELLQQLFKIITSSQQLEAEVWYNYSYTGDSSELKLTEEMIMSFLQMNHITFGLIRENIRKWAEAPLQIDYPILVARGINKKDGKNGQIKYIYDTNTEVDRTKGWDFREVMRIPTVKSGDKLATLTPPTDAINGRTVHDKAIYAIPGKPYLMKAGKMFHLIIETNRFMPRLRDRLVLDTKQYMFSMFMKYGKISL